MRFTVLTDIHPFMVNSHTDSGVNQLVRSN